MRLYRHMHSLCRASCKRLEAALQSQSSAQAAWCVTAVPCPCMMRHDSNVNAQIEMFDGNLRNRFISDLDTRKRLHASLFDMQADAVTRSLKQQSANSVNSDGYNWQKCESQ